MKKYFLFHLVSIVAAWIICPLAQSQVSQPIKSFGFSNLSGDGSRSALIEGDDGSLYGTTEYGGPQDSGTVFKVAKAGTNYTVLLSFSGTGTNGARPYAGLLKANTGILYGTTCYGGSNNVGTIFQLTQSGNNYSVLKNFSTNSGDGLYPRAGLMQASDGLLYGTTYWGGTSNLGTVFRLDTNGGSYAVLKSFTGKTNDGGKPFAALVEGTNGALFGTTFTGGLTNQGTVFTLKKDGTGFAVLKSFTGTNGDGRFPCASLTVGSDNLLYGSTRSGGSSSNWGTIFRLGQNGSNYTVVGGFTITNGGFHPHGQLIEGSDGSLYGTTYQGGVSNCGTVFKISKNGTGGIVVLTNFMGVYANGANPEAGLLKASDGMLYGTTYRGGADNYGTLFNLAEAGTNFADLRDFSLSGGDGSYPNGIFQASDGLLYGITEGGGSNDLGTVFKMNDDGSGLAILHHFNPTNADGNYPMMLREGDAGWLYGTTYSGGVSNLGTVFKLDKNGTNYTVLKSFTNSISEGANPYFSTESGDGRLFGTACFGGANSDGVVFGLNTDGSAYTVLYSFTGTGGDGANPGAGFVITAAGVLYGTTEAGVSSSNGIVYALNTNGSGYAILKQFTGSSNGGNPWGALILDSDGMLYGTTAGDTINSNGAGAVFKINTNGGNYQVLHNFNNADFPVSGLVKAPNGLLYGTTEFGGTSNLGTVFLLDKNGRSYAVPLPFTGGNTGSQPQGMSAAGGNGLLYGTTVEAGGMGLGTVYALTSCVAITSIQLGNPAILNLAGASNQTYQIQATTNLTSPLWESLGSSTVGSTGVSQFTDFTIPNYPARFYRSLTP